MRSTSDCGYKMAAESCNIPGSQTCAPMSRTTKIGLKTHATQKLFEAGLRTVNIAHPVAFRGVGTPSSFRAPHEFQLSHAHPDVICPLNDLIRRRNPLVNSCRRLPAPEPPPARFMYPARAPSRTLTDVHLTGSTKDRAAGRPSRQSARRGYSVRESGLATDPHRISPPAAFRRTSDAETVDGAYAVRAAPGEPRRPEEVHQSGQLAGGALGGPENVECSAARRW